MDGFRVYLDLNPVGLFYEFDMDSERKKLRMTDNLLEEV